MTPAQNRFLNRLVAHATRPARVKNALLVVLASVAELTVFLLIIAAAARMFGW